MLWNHIIHIVAGIFGASIFLWTGDGILLSAIIAALSQATDTIRMYFYHKNHILSAPEGVREEQMHNFKEGALYKFAQLYIVKVIWYGVVTLITAQLMRSFST